MNTELYKSTIKAIKSTSVNAKTELEAYLSSLSGFDQLKLSFSFEEIKAAHKKYRAYLSALLRDIDKLDASFATISRLMAELDKEDDINGIKALSNKLEAYILWKHAAGELITKTDEIFKNKGEKFALSKNVLYVRSFVLATDNFISETDK